MLEAYEQVCVGVCDDMSVCVCVSATHLLLFLSHLLTPMVDLFWCVATSIWLQAFLSVYGSTTSLLTVTDGMTQ